MGGAVGVVVARERQGPTMQTACSGVAVGCVE